MLVSANISGEAMTETLRKLRHQRWLMKQWSSNRSDSWRCLKEEAISNIPFGTCLHLHLHFCFVTCHANQVNNTLITSSLTDTNGTATIFNATVHSKNCVCSRIYDPVCGSDEKSYYNVCQLQCETESNVTVVHQGNCIPFWKVASHE